MSRVSLAVLKTDKDKMMKRIQEFQGIELIDENDKKELYEEEVTRRSEYTKKIQEIKNAQSVLQTFVKKNTLKQLRQGRDELTFKELQDIVGNSDFKELCDTILELDAKKNEIRTKRKENLSKQESLRPWTGLDVSLDKLPQLKYSVAEIGSVASTAKLEWAESLATSELNTYYEELSDNNKTTSYFLLYHQNTSDQMEVIKKSYAFQNENTICNQVPKDYLNQLKKEETKLVEAEKVTLEKLEKMATSIGNLNLAEEYYTTLAMRAEEGSKLVKTKATALFSGWIIQSEIANFTKFLAKEFDPATYYFDVADISDEDIVEEIPVALKNNKIVEPFEMLTEMYSLPKYNEIDPTPFITPFQLVFFGMMMGDLGYGAILFIATLLAKKLFKLDKGARRGVDFFYLLSYPTMAWGLIYGSAFGIALPFHVLSTATDVIQILILSVVFGFIQIITGLSLGAYKSVKEKDVPGALSGSVSWILCLSGLALIALGKIVLLNTLIFKIGLGMALLGVAFVLFIPVIVTKKSRVGAFFLGLWDLYGATGFIGDLVSYTRLMALGLSGGSIAAAFNTILGFLPFPVKITLGVFLALAMHGLNMFLSLLSAYVHSMRLQYVEFFGKFHTGGGRKFSPFKAAEKHIYIKNETIKK